eukprot:1797529-Rhodomonas_salina.1
MARMILDRCTRVESAEAMRFKRTRNDMIATWWTPKRKQGTEANQKSTRFSRVPTLRESTERTVMLVEMTKEDGMRQHILTASLPNEHLQ